MALVRVTLSLDRRLMEEAGLHSGGNLSQFVAQLLEDRLNELRRQQLRDELRAGYEAEAEHDLAIAAEYCFVDNELARRGIPPTTCPGSMRPSR